MFGSAEEFAELRAALEDARAHGLTFGWAWTKATASVPMPADAREALRETRYAWQAAYEGEDPTPAERCLGFLVERRTPEAAASSQRPTETHSR